MSSLDQRPDTQINPGKLSDAQLELVAQRAAQISKEKGSTLDKKGFMQRRSTRVGAGVVAVTSLLSAGAYLQSLGGGNEASAGTDRPPENSGPAEAGGGVEALPSAQPNPNKSDYTDPAAVPNGENTVSVVVPGPGIETSAVGENESPDAGQQPGGQEEPAPETDGTPMGAYDMMSAEDFTAIVSAEDRLAFLHTELVPDAGKYSEAQRDDSSQQILNAYLFFRKKAYGDLVEEHPEIPGKNRIILKDATKASAALYENPSESNWHATDVHYFAGPGQKQNFDLEDEFTALDDLERSTEEGLTAVKKITFKNQAGETFDSVWVFETATDPNDPDKTISQWLMRSGIKRG